MRFDFKFRTVNQYATALHMVTAYWPDDPRKDTNLSIHAPFGPREATYCRDVAQLVGA